MKVFHALLRRPSSGHVGMQLSPDFLSYGLVHALEIGGDFLSVLKLDMTQHHLP